MTTSFKKAGLLHELSFKTTRSGGPGGQHANKTETKVVVEWDIAQTKLFNNTQQQRLQNRLKTYITNTGILQLSCEESRSQHTNKDIVVDRLVHLITTNLHRPKKRKPPKPGKKYHKKRLEEKKRQAEKKANRKNPLF